MIADYALIGALLLFAPPASSAEHKGEPSSAAPETVPNASVVGQDGRPLRFYQDLMKDKIAVINFIFTTCRGICGPQGANFARLQTLLGDQLGRSVNLVSVSMDPATDTPERIAEWAQQFGAKPGWTVVTGQPSEVDRISMALRGEPARPGSHSPVLFIIDDRTKTKLRVYGLAAPARLAQQIAELAEAGAIPR